MSKPFYKGRLSINKEKSSPYWMVTFQGPDGKMKRRSTKVPVNGGEFEGDRITAKLAERLAYQRGVQIACAEAEEYQAHNNVSVRAWCEDYVRRCRKIRRGTPGRPTSIFTLILGRGLTPRCV